MRSSYRLNLTLAAIFLLGLALLLLMGTNRSLFVCINSMTARSSPFTHLEKI